jgi:hypothetical protein
MRRIDFPIRPHLLKFLTVHMNLRTDLSQPDQLADYVLSSVGQWGLPLTFLLSKPVKSARHEGSIDDCTAKLGVNLRNFKAPYYDLIQGKLSPFTVFKFNEYVEGWFRKEVYWWVGQHQQRRGTVKDGILACLAFYEVSPDEIAFSTLRRDVERNSPLLRRKKKNKNGKKSKNFSMNLSQKMGDMSQKTGDVSQKIGVLSHKDAFSSVQQELMKLPIPIFGSGFYYGSSSAHAA